MVVGPTFTSQKMEDPSLMTNANRAYSWGHEEFGYRLYDPVEKKVIRSKGMVFLEDHTLQDPEPSEMLDFTPDFSVTEHPTPTLDTEGHGGDTEEYDDIDDDAADDDDDDGHNHEHHTLGD